ncbi:MAG: hypothetical protein LBK94_03850 [Prevotellaceae bacterium]|jgi:hypothetical protein|nr:hypothetical protein [Prevotellaceae bacterium]
MRTIFLTFIFACIIGISQTHAQIVFEITIQNNRPFSVDITLLSGDLFEVQGENMQHIALFADTTIILLGRETKTIQLRGYCTNEHRNSPGSGQSVLPTAIIINASTSVFSSQECFWKYLRGIPC